MKDKELLQRLIHIGSTPGNETALRDFLVQELSQYGSIVRTKWNGFYCAYKHNTPEKDKNIVITAHMDSPGFIVQDIQADGTLSIIALGCLAPKQVNLRRVMLYTSGKNYPGILTWKSDSQKTCYQDAVYSGFFGFRSRAQAIKAGVLKGDMLCFDAPVLNLANDFVAAPHLDNRLGIYSMLELARTFTDNPDYNLYFAATGCEEVNGRGAYILAQMLQPDLALCLDVTYEEGSVKMGKGPVVTLSDGGVFLSTKQRNTLLKIAKKSRIAIQMEVMNSSTTDAHSFSKVPGGCLALAFLIPTLNNHTPHEICCLKDLAKMHRWLLAVLRHHKDLLTD